MTFIATLASGSSGNAAILSDGETNILIDAGISCRRIKTELARFGIPLSALDAVLLTHEHSDHTKGLETLFKTHPCPIYLTDGTARGLSRSLLSDYWVAGGFRIVRAGEDFSIGHFGFSPIATPHDAAESVGYLIERQGRRALYATDLGAVPDEILSAAKLSECVFIESNHDVYSLLRGSYPDILKHRILSARGHLSNDDCADLVRAAAESGARRFTLCHLSRENNTPELALAASRSALEEAGLSAAVEVAPPNEPSAPYIFE